MGIKFGFLKYGQTVRKGGKEEEKKKVYRAEKV